MKKRDGKTVTEILAEIDRHVVSKKIGCVSKRTECPRRRPGDDPCWVIGKGKPIRKTVKVTSDDIVRDRVWVQQYWCKAHGKFRELPTFLLPRLRHAAWIVEAAVAGRVARQSLKVLCDRLGLWNPTTPGRWVSGLLDRLGQIGRGAQRRLSNLVPERRPETRERWLLAEVWKVLGELRQAWTDRGYLQRPRIYHALTL